MPSQPPDRDQVLDPSVLDSYRLLQEDGEPDLITELIDGFLADLEGRLHAIRRAIAGGDAPALRSAAHSLKGSSGTVGAIGLAQRCGELEALGREGRVDEAGPLLDDLAALIPEVGRALSALREPGA